MLIYFLEKKTRILRKWIKVHFLYIMDIIEVVIYIWYIFRRRIFVKPILDASGECIWRPGSSSSGADFEPSFSDSVLSRGSSPFSDCAFKTDCSSPESTSRSARVALVKFHFLEKIGFKPKLTSKTMYIWKGRYFHRKIISM